MNLLVTGGCGFIGSHVVESLVNRARVERLVNLDCLTYAGRLENVAAVAAHPRYVFERVDLRDKAEVRRVVLAHEISHVLHLAAESHVDRSITGPEAFIQTNVVGTFHLLEACREAWKGAGEEETRFVQVSTDEVFGSLGSDGAFTEASPYAPNSPYAASKASADLLARAAGHTYGLPVVITNCSNNFGSRQFPEKLIPVVIACVRAGRPVPVYGDGQQVRDWLFVGDHVEALWQVLTRGRTGESYVIGARNECTNLRLVETVCDLIDELSPARGGGSRRVISFVEDRPGHDWRYALDPAKVERELGWRPAETLATGLRATVQWYLDHPEWFSSCAWA